MTKKVLVKKPFMEMGRLYAPSKTLIEVKPNMAWVQRRLKMKHLELVEPAATPRTPPEKDKK